MKVMVLFYISLFPIDYSHIHSSLWKKKKFVDKSKKRSL